MAPSLYVDARDGEFDITIDWWLVSVSEPGYEGCSGSVGGLVTNPVDLTILSLSTGWHGCAQRDDFVVQLKIHEVYSNGIDLEWWVWERP